MIPTTVGGQAMAAVIDKAQVEARDLLVAHAQRVLRICPSLDHYTDAMGAQFFVWKGGPGGDGYTQSSSWEGLPATAQTFLREVAGPYFDTFRSLGWKVYRDHIVEDW